MALSVGSETGSTSQHSSDITPEQEYFLYELETSETIGLVLRAIYDGGDAHKFMHALELKIKHYDRDIERLCNFHYQSFNDSVKELLQLKDQCAHLKNEITLIDSHLRESAEPLLKNANDIVKSRRMQQNIAKAISCITLCLPMFEKYAKLQELMQNNRHYPALKALEQLEHTYFNNSFFKDYKFTQKIQEQVSCIRNEIKASSDHEFKNFLERVRKASSRVGEVALRHVGEHHNMRELAIEEKTSARRQRRAQQLMTHGSPNKSAALPPDEEEEFSAQDLVDFQPIFKCCHIFSVLGAKESFETFYQTERKKQAELTLIFPEKQIYSFDNYLKYFHEIIGFFVIEDTVMKTTRGLVTKNYRDALWDSALQKISKSLNDHFGNCTDADAMLNIKTLILLFALTMKEYGYNVQPIYKLLQNFRDQYNEILMSQCCAKFEEILRTDNYTPIEVRDEADYKRVFERFRISIRSVENAPFPKKFPFSEFVPNIFDQLKIFSKNCFKFTDKLGLSQTEIDDALRRSVNILLERLSGCLKGFISSRQLQLTQLVQITINMGYLEKSCELLEQYITSRLVGTTQSSIQSVKIKQGTHMFTDARSEVEQQIYDNLNQKITAFLENAHYDWEILASSGRASGYVVDLIMFLDSTFKSFTNLPVGLARAACMSACKHLSSELLRFPLDSDVKAISTEALEQFNLDVMQCELFTSQCPVPGFEDGTLQLTFADLRQLLDLMISRDWSTYIADFGQERNKYIRVNPQNAILILEKLLEMEKRKGSGIFSKVSAKDKDRQKLLETVLKQLRNLTNSA